MKMKNEYDQNLVDYIKAHAHERNLFVASIKHVSASGMTRKIAVGMVMHGEFVNITPLVAEVTGWSLDRDLWAVKVGGCGMDMILHTLGTFLSAIMPESGHTYRAAQHCKTL